MAADHEVALARVITDTQERLNKHAAETPRDHEIILRTRQLIEDTRAFLRGLPPIEKAFQAWRSPDAGGGPRSRKTR